MSGPPPSSSQCPHEHTYYDDKGLRCKDCGESLPVRPLPGKGSQFVAPFTQAWKKELERIPLEREFPELWGERDAAAEEMGVEGW
jgi:hypothetical protein